MFKNVLVFIALSFFINPSLALACIPASLDSTRKISDIIVEGTFVIVDKEAGFGYIIPRKVTKGIKNTRYEISWGFSEKAEGSEETAEEYDSADDCRAGIPSSGEYGIFYLEKNDANFYWIIGKASATREN